jgi:NAD(P)-dependent dehydrogenase (short-subunit alcohol dehydrogenase family)
MNTTALDGTVALITGASNRIGDATARQQAEHGASVVVTARARRRLERLVSELEAAGGSALAVPADIPVLRAKRATAGPARLTCSSPMAGLEQTAIAGARTTLLVSVCKQDDRRCQQGARPSTKAVWASCDATGPSAAASSLLEQSRRRGRSGDKGRSLVGARKTAVG